MKLKIKPFTDHVKLMYQNHGHFHDGDAGLDVYICLLYTSPSPRDQRGSRIAGSA